MGTNMPNNGIGRQAGEPITAGWNFQRVCRWKVNGWVVGQFE
jgi:hypothetical protein